MVKHTVSEEYSSGYSLFDSSSTYTFTSDFYATNASNDAISEPLAYSNNTIIMQGVVSASASNYAIRSNGDDSTIEVGKSGVLTGPGFGIESYGDDLFVHNFGLIGTAGGRSMDLNGNDANIVNEAGGVIVGRITVNPSEESSVMTFENHGIANLGSYIGSFSTDKITNDGRIVGEILLMEGNDTLDTRGGTVRGIIEGNIGNDTLITDNAKYVLLEYTDGGYDTVKSTVTYSLSDNVENLLLLGSRNIDGNGQDWSNILKGNSGNNTLAGYSGNDRLDGKGGNDVLNGGDQQDTFVFGTGYGKDTIQDLVVAEDTVDLSGWKAIKNDNLVKSHATEHGADLWIASGKDILVLKGFEKGDLQDVDFSF